MNAHHLLCADESVLANIEDVLRANEICYRRTPIETLNHGLRTVDMFAIQCRDERGFVDLVVEKRRTRQLADLMLIPSRRFTFWRHRESDRLSDRLAILLRQSGARDI